MLNYRDCSTSYFTVACSAKWHNSSPDLISSKHGKNLEGSPAFLRQHHVTLGARVPARIDWKTTRQQNRPLRAVSTTAQLDHSKDGIEKKSTTSVSRRIHVLGPGNAGKLVAHSLAGIPNRPPITLLLHHRGQVNDWFKEGRSIKIVQHGVHEETTGFDIELVLPLDHESSSLIPEEDIIDNLVVSVKASATADALSNVAHRLSKDSTVLFLQDGMGIMDEVNEKVFNDPQTRPKLMLGIVTHRLEAKSSFSSSLNGIGTIGLGYIADQRQPRLDFREDSSQPIPPSARYLLRTITRTPFLAAMGLTAPDLYQLQLEKLSSTAVINPLTVMFNCKNGELLGNFAITRVMRLLIAEISLVVKSLPELRDIPNVNARFSPSKLEYQVISIAKTTAASESPMLQDVKGGRLTDIDYFNGYIVRRGEELGIRCVMNYMLMQMVKGKQQMETRNLAARVPMERATELPLIEREEPR